MPRYQTTVRLGDLPPYKGKKGDLVIAFINLVSAVTMPELQMSEVESAINRDGIFRLTTPDGRHCTIRPVK